MFVRSIVRQYNLWYIYVCTHMIEQSVNRLRILLTTNRLSRRLTEYSPDQSFMLHFTFSPKKTVSQSIHSFNRVPIRDSPTQKRLILYETLYPYYRAFFYRPKFRRDSDGNS